MLNIKISATTVIVLLSLVAYSQSTEVIDKLRSNSDEILIMRVMNDSTVFLMENFRCYSSAYGDIVEILKQSKIPSDKKKVIVLHSAKCDDDGFPHTMKLIKKKKYFVFLSTKNLDVDKIRKDIYSKIQFSTSDYYLGILEYNEDMHKYLRR